MKVRDALRLVVLAVAAVLTAPSSFAETPSGAVTLPEIPAAVGVALDARTSALLILDINTQVCQPNPACTATVPAIAALAKRARSAKVPVIYSTTVNPKGPPPALADVTPQANEPTVVARADKFIDTKLDDLLKQHKATTLVIVGSAANGAVLYTSFHANVLGYTVVVAEDGISAYSPFNTFLTRHQLLQQPGFTNAGNKPLADKMVTLSRTDLIAFK